MSPQFAGASRKKRVFANSSLSNYRKNDLVSESLDAASIFHLRTNAGSRQQVETLGSTSKRGGTQIFDLNAEDSISRQQVRMPFEEDLGNLEVAIAEPSMFMSKRRKNKLFKSVVAQTSS